VRVASGRSGSSCPVAEQAGPQHLPHHGQLSSAIRDVESTGLTVCAVASDDLVSLKDIAARAGLSYESARLLASASAARVDFPRR